MNSEQLEKQLFEAALRHAVSECIEEECAPIREKYANSAAPDYSHGFRLRMKRLLNKNKHRTGAGWQTYGKRAAGVAIVLGIGFFSAMSVDAVRVPITDFFLSITEKGTVIDFSGSKGNALDIPKDWDFVYAPTYLPKGYIQTKTEHIGNYLDTTYRSDVQQDIMFQQSQSFEGMLALDTEDAITERVAIGASDGLYVEKDGSSMLLWSNSDGWYLLMTSLGREETIKIAESVKKIEK
ncbi:MAG: DUF4367 domain-containing protein [Angelakisella sp.]